MHKCDTCQYKGEHQEMGFKPCGVCTKEHDLIKAVLAYRAKKCPFAKKVELEPCPFCGKQPRIFQGFVPSEDGIVYQVLCINHDCKNPPLTNFSPTKKMAIDEWNERMEADR